MHLEHKPNSILNIVFHWWKLQVSASQTVLLTFTSLIQRNGVHIRPQLSRAKDEPGIQMLIISIFTKTRYEERDSFFSDHFNWKLAEGKWGNGAKQMIKSERDLFCRFTKHYIYLGLVFYAWRAVKIKSGSKV